MDTGGWMDTHTVCFILQPSIGSDPDIDVNKLVGLIRATQGERYEAAVYYPDPDDDYANSVLDRKTDAKMVDPIASELRFDPRNNPYQAPKDRPRGGGGYYVGYPRDTGSLGSRDLRP